MVRKGTRWACLLIVFCLLLLIPSASAVSLASAPLTTSTGARNGMVRVRLSSLGSVTQLSLTIDGSYTADGAQNVVLQRGSQVNISINSTSGQLTLTAGGTVYPMGQTVAFRRHVTSGDNGLRISQAKKPSNLYPGDLLLSAVKGSTGTYTIQPVLYVYMESYLCGVVPYEMGESAGLEAIKAQTVAARTYTLNRMNQRTSWAYDVVDTTNDQVYYGSPDGAGKCTTAINSTKGIVLMNGGVLTNTYYSASNGGQTESAENAWGTVSSALIVKDDPFDLANSQSTVKRFNVYRDNTNPLQAAAFGQFLLNKATEALNNAGQPVLGLRVLTIDEIIPHTPKYAAPSKLYTKMDFALTVSCNGQTQHLTVTGDIFSELEGLLGMSINSLRNELWSVESNASAFVLCARRFGHGVGLSQRGAMQMAALGYAYDQILAFYYNGCKRVQYTLTHTILGGIQDGGDTLITATESPAPLEESAASQAVVTLAMNEDHLVLHSGKSVNSTPLCTVLNGTQLTLRQMEGEWAYVRYGNISGYALVSSLQIRGEAEGAEDGSDTILCWATVACNGTLNLRSEAGYGNNIVAAMPDGTVLCVFAKNDSWTRVQYGSTVGYAATSYLQFSMTNPVSQMATQSGIGVVVGVPVWGVAMLRATPATDGVVLAQIPYGENVTILGGDSSWYQVRYQEQVGYVKVAEISRYAQAPSTAEDTWVGDDAPEDEDSVPTPVPTPAVTVRPEATATAAPTATEAGSTPDPTVPAEATETPERTASPEATQTPAPFATDEPTATPKATESPAPPAELQGEAGMTLSRVSTSGGTLNLRAAPTTKSKVLLTISNGTVLNIYEKDGDWCRTIYRGKEGYVMTSFLQPEQQEETGEKWDHLAEDETETMPSPKPTGVEKTYDPTLTVPEDQWVGWVNTGSGSLNLRAWCALNAPALAQMPEGDPLTVLAMGEEWTKILWEGTEGYCLTKYLMLRPCD